EPKLLVSRPRHKIDDPLLCKLLRNAVRALGHLRCQSPWPGQTRRHHKAVEEVNVVLARFVIQQNERTSIDNALQGGAGYGAPDRLAVNGNEDGGSRREYNLRRIIFHWHSPSHPQRVLDGKHRLQPL